MGFQVSVVNVRLEYQHGGELKAQVSVEVFKAVWAQVCSEGHYKLYPWTVKVEAESVFFPSRLRHILKGYADPDSVEAQGVYLTSGQSRLQGPIEVFSRAAVQVLVSGWHRCTDNFYMSCHGPCWWGEDLFIDRCLSQVFHATQRNEGLLLGDAQRSALRDWTYCQDHSRVAFYPFKTADSYKQCLSSARSEEGDEEFYFK